MRLWLVSRGPESADPCLESVLFRLVEQSEGNFQLVGSSSLPELLPERIRTSAADLIVAQESACPEEHDLSPVLDLGVALVVATPPARSSRFLTLGEQYPVWVLPASPEIEQLQLALLGALAARKRHAHTLSQLDRLQQRLNDRVLIERAKGILVHRLGITEEEAYNRLRLSSRRQRRQIRDIAQSLLDTQSLLLPEANGAPPSDAAHDGTVSPDPET